MAGHKLRVLPVGISMLLVLQPMGLGWAQDNRKLPERDAALAHFREAHEQAAKEAGLRRDGLRPEPILSQEQLVSLAPSPAPMDCSARRPPTPRDLRRRL